MDKKLIDRAWRILPAEFREEVKKIYQDLTAAYDEYAKEEAWDTANAIYSKICILREVFGHHNLTSDAEGEELGPFPLTVTPLFRGAAVAWRLIKKWFNRYEKKHLIGGTITAVSRDGQSTLRARITGVRLLKGGGHRKSLEFNTKPVEQ